MSRRVLCGWLLLAAVCFSAAQGADAKRKVLFIGIDGCRFDTIEAANTPNLDKLMADGCYDSDCLILGERYQKNDTISGPGWSSILTSVWADKHGVHDNSFKGRNYEKFPHLFARLKEARPEARTASVVTWIPIQQFIVSGADVARQFIPLDGGYAKADEAAVKAAVKLLAEDDPTILFYYIGQVDEAGHKHGFHPTVKEYVAAVEQADKLVGEVVDAMRARKTYADEEWLVLVTSDHGGKGTSHSAGHQVPEILNSFVIVSGEAAQRGKIDGAYLVDVPATALAYLGVEPKEEWGLDGKPVGLK
ncbi:MAG: alkaline phosphatase family protein [Pirellulales bacterium]|nr:alkaline phosphatase family protein [Pirellulales bacterium]